MGWGQGPIPPAGAPARAPGSGVGRPENTREPTHTATCRAGAWPGDRTAGWLPWAAGHGAPTVALPVHRTVGMPMSPDPAPRLRQGSRLLSRQGRGETSCASFRLGTLHLASFKMTFHRPEPPIFPRFRHRSARPDGQCRFEQNPAPRPSHGGLAIPRCSPCQPSVHLGPLSGRPHPQPLAQLSGAHGGARHSTCPPGGAGAPEGEWGGAGLPASPSRGLLGPCGCTPVRAAGAPGTCMVSL